MKLEPTVDPKTGAIRIDVTYDAPLLLGPYRDALLRDFDGVRIVGGLCTPTMDDGECADTVSLTWVVEVDRYVAGARDEWKDVVRAVVRRLREINDVAKEHERDRILRERRARERSRQVLDELIEEKLFS